MSETREFRVGDWVRVLETNKTGRVASEGINGYFEVDVEGVDRLITFPYYWLKRIAPAPNSGQAEEAPS